MVLHSPLDVYYGVPVCFVYKKKKKKGGGEDVDVLLILTDL